MTDIERYSSKTWLIIIISIVIPILVALLYYIPKPDRDTIEWIWFLPHFNAIVNSLTTITLITGYILIRNGRKQEHKFFMSLSFFLGIAFLLSYVIYHSNAVSTVYGDLNGNGVLDSDESLEIGSWRNIYLLILLLHILTAIVVVPFVLLAFYYALSNRFDQHKKIVKYTFPLWIFVSVSGVVVYLMISPYY